MAASAHLLSLLLVLRLAIDKLPRPQLTLPAAPQIWLAGLGASTASEARGAGPHVIGCLVEAALAMSSNLLGCLGVGAEGAADL